MTDALLIVSLVVAAGLCPLMMWRNARQGHPAACCVSARPDAEAPTAEELRRRLQDIDAQIAEHADATSAGVAAGRAS